MNDDLNRPAPATDDTDPLVCELLVRNLARSLRFYIVLGFVVERQDDGFAVLVREDRRLFLATATLPPATTMRMNLRLLVPDVDSWWTRLQAIGCVVHQPIADRPYGLRDFTVLDPDGFGVRLATPLVGRFA